VRDERLARAYQLSVVVGCLVVLLLAARHIPRDGLRQLVLFLAGGIAAELLYVRPDRRTAGLPYRFHTIGFAGGVYLAAAIVLGPWQGAVCAAAGSLFSRPIRDTSWRMLRFNASMTALAVFAAGFVFLAAGGHSESLDLATQWPALLAFFVTFYTVNDTMLAVVIRLTTGGRLRRLLTDIITNAGSGYPAECGLVTVLAILVLHAPWSVVALVPVIFAMYQGQSRLAALRRETNRALETFANIVDERDDSTFKHSERVADLVGSLARALQLDPAAIGRLEWSARLHDLGKIAVDAGILRKPGRLDDAEWATMRLHPRLSARILRRFRFAGAEARAVEYHHERYDGHGYFGIAGEQIPLASHMLVVADSFDAMTSNRAYRSALSLEQALAEVESNAGAQFHPLIARAFVAYQRGIDPLTVLSDAELSELVRLARPDSTRGRELRSLVRRRLPELVLVGGSVATLLAAGLGLTFVALPAGVVALVGLAIRVRERQRSAFLRAALVQARTLDEVADLATVAGRLVWAGYVRWYETSAGAVPAEWSGSSERPDEVALVSWLLRETDAGIDLLQTEEAELGEGRIYVAAMIAPPRGAPAAYLVLGFDGEPARWLGSALLEALPTLEETLDISTPQERRTRLAEAS
jgi:HD-GYP domain-containing protein (c-di-GMP phosphodiesterase class II)